MDAGKLAQIKGEGELRFAKAGLTLVGYYAVLLILSMVPFGAFTGMGRILIHMPPVVNGIFRITFQCLISMFLIGPLTVGMKKGMLNLKESEDITGCLFYAFDSTRYMKIVRGLVLYTLIGVVMSVLNFIDEMLPIKLFYVPVIFMSFAIAFIQVFMLCFVEYLVAEDHDISPVDACTKSINLMNGHKKDLWNFILLYLKEILICIVTCGLGLFYYVPKYQCGFTCFYEHLKENSDT